VVSRAHLGVHNIKVETRFRLPTDCLANVRMALVQGTTLQVGDKKNFFYVARKLFLGTNIFLLFLTLPPRNLPGILADSWQKSEPHFLC
jgi:hypothetical protein